MKKIIEIAIFIIGLILCAYLWLWMAIPCLLLFGLITGVATEGWSFAACVWLSIKCYQAGTAFWLLALEYLIVYIILTSFAEHKGWNISTAQKTVC